MSELPFTSLTDLARMLTLGETTSTELVEACLGRIAALDDRLHAFVDVYADTARDCARAADLQRRGGVVRGALHGLPIAIKDLFHIEGRQTTAGAKSWIGRKSAHTATAVRRLLAAGAIPLGKTHMVEFAFGTWGRNEPMGAPWNPWDRNTHRVAGGSSSGSAVAVAAGFAPAAIGSDTGGSVRIPAALCNLTGLKTTYGLISLGNVVPLSPTLDSVGPITRTVEDAALLGAVMAGPDPIDPATLAAPAVDLIDATREEPDLRGLRITALAAEQFPQAVGADVATARDDTVRVLRELGAIVDEAECPFDFDDLRARNGELIAAEAYALHRAYIEDAALPFDPWVQRRIVAGKSVSAADYIDLLTQRRRDMARFAEWMKGRAALLTPTVPITAPPLAEVDESKAPLAAFTRAFNYLGACALTVPAGFDSDGLPIGMQVAGAPFHETTIVRIGRAFQHATDFHTRRPAL